MRSYYKFIILFSITLLFVNVNSCVKSKGFSIVGTWNFSESWNSSLKNSGNNNGSDVIGSKHGLMNISEVTFTGTKTSGTFIDNFGDTGKYTTNESTVSFTYDQWPVTFSGNSEDSDHMSGSMKNTQFGNTGNWSAIRKH